MRNLPDPRFAGDDGAAEPGLAAALAAYGADPDRLHHETLAVLQHARLLVPVIAVLGEVGFDEQERERDKTSDMAAVLMRGQDGRLALLTFTSTASMNAWNPQARPVPVPVAQAARAALDDDAAALVVDVAGPVLFVVEEDDLRSLAEGYTLVQLNGRLAWVRSQEVPRSDVR